MFLPLYLLEYGLFSDYQSCLFSDFEIKDLFIKIITNSGLIKFAFVNYIRQFN